MQVPVTKSCQHCSGTAGDLQGKNELGLLLDCNIIWQEIAAAKSTFFFGKSLYNTSYLSHIVMQELHHSATFCHLVCLVFHFCVGKSHALFLNTVLSKPRHRRKWLQTITTILVSPENITLRQLSALNNGRISSDSVMIE